MILGTENFLLKNQFLELSSKLNLKIPVLNNEKIEKCLKNKQVVYLIKIKINSLSSLAFFQGKEIFK